MVRATPLHLHAQQPSPPGNPLYIFPSPSLPISAFPRGNCQAHALVQTAPASSPEPHQSLLPGTEVRHQCGCGRCGQPCHACVSTGRSTQVHAHTCGDVYGHRSEALQALQPALLLGPPSAAETLPRRTWDPEKHQRGSGEGHWSRAKPRGGPTWSSLGSQKLWEGPGLARPHRTI